MQNNLVVQFETQMQSNIKEIAFPSVEIWQKHLMYMLSNVDQLWINILSAFVNRTDPKRVLLLSQWAAELGKDNLMILKGATGIPFLVKGNDQPDNIVHDAWDISDLKQGDNFIVTYPLFQRVNEMKERYGLVHDNSFWNSFITNVIMENLYFSKLIHDNEFKKFIVSSLKFLTLGEIDIDMTYIVKQESNTLIEIYKNIFQLITNLECKYIEVADRLGQEIEKENKLKIALIRSERMLPERLRDAERKIKQKQKQPLTDYDPEDMKERSKFENV